MKIVKLGDVCKIIAGQSPPSSTYNNEGDGLPFFQGKADFGYLYPKVRVWCSKPKKVAEVGDILISVRAPVGPTNVCDTKSCIGRGLSAIRTGNDLNSDFLLFYLRFIEDKLSQTGSGSTFKAITQNDLKAIDVPLPSLEEQRKIVKLLNQADLLRQKRKQAIDLLDEYLKSVFFDMFGDLISNPKGWDMKKLSQIMISGPQNGLYRPSSDYGLEGTPILRIDSFYDGKIASLKSLKRLVIPENIKLLYQLENGDIVINRVNSPSHLGKSALIVNLEEPTVFESNMMRFSINQNFFNTVFLIKVLQTQFIKKQILKRAKDAVNQSSINQEDVKSFIVPQPPLELQIKFAGQVREAEKTKENMITQSEELDKQFQALMQESFRPDV